MKLMLRQWARSTLQNRLGRGLALMILLLNLNGLNGLAAPSAQEPRDSEEMFARGVEHIKNGRWTEAETLFSALLSRQETALLHHHLGICYQGQKDHDKAIEEFRKALALDPGLRGSRALLGASLRASGQKEEGILELERAVQEHPVDLLVTLELIRAYESDGRHLDALGQYQQLAKGRPEDPEAAYLLGKAYSTFSEWCYQELARVQLDSPRAHQALAQHQLARGDLAAAERSLLRAIELGPEVLDLHLVLAQIYVRLNRLSDALRHVETELELMPANRGAQQLKQQLLSRTSSQE